jgi:hypothetical protein
LSDQQNLPTQGDLFTRIAAILEQARGSVRRAINTNMVLAYWCIGREITLAIQGGEVRAEYGKQVVADLSERLTKQFGAGFSVRSLLNFRQFYNVYASRFEIPLPSGAESSVPILSPSMNTSCPGTCKGVPCFPRFYVGVNVGINR